MKRIKNKLKKIPLVIKCYRLYNMTMNLLFRRNNLIRCYLTSYMNKNIIDIAWDSKLYDCKFSLGSLGG